MSETQQKEIQKAVEYLQQSDVPINSKLSVVKNATGTGKLNVEDILSGYADAVQINGVIYPMHESQLRELHNAIETEVDQQSVNSLEEICHPYSLVDDKEAVITQAINVYTDSAVADGEKRELIKELIRDAQRDGINVTGREVVRSLKEFSSSSGSSGASVEEVSVGMVSDGKTLATGIETPSEIQADSEYVYQVTLEDDVSVENIDWFIGGTHAGSGETILHTFDYAGVYTIAVEIVDSNGDTDYVNKEVKVEDAPSIEVSIVGTDVVNVGETVEYEATITSNNDSVTGVSWELDNTVVGEDKTFSTTFESEGIHDLSLTVHSESGNSVTETKTVTVDVPTDIDVEMDAPDQVFVGEEATVDYTVQTENSRVEKTKGTIEGEEISVDPSQSGSFEYQFTETGEHSISVTAENDVGDRVTATETVECFIEPTVELLDPPEEVIRGDEKEFEIVFDDRLDSKWGVSDASLTEVGDSTAQVLFNSGIADEAIITVEVENKAGDVEEDTAEVIVKEPSVDAVISGAEQVTTGEVAEFSVEDTEVEYAEIDRVEWQLDDGTIIGKGETVSHKFPSIGEYSVSATVYTDRGVGDTETIQVTVNPETDVTAVAVSKGGETTHDEFVLDGSKSVSKNTTISSYSWSVEGEQKGTGETLNISFDAPGEYEVELLVETEAGDVDTDTLTATVAQYTSVRASVDGPDEILVGDRARFSARGSEPINTTITEYNWLLNDKPVGSGEIFTQTFSTPGHYTIRVEVETATGDIDTASSSVLVQQEEVTVDAKITGPNATEPKVGETITLSAQETEVKSSDLGECTWVVDGDTLKDTSATVEIRLNKYGEIPIELTATASDGSSDTVTHTLYVRPSLEQIPYDKLSEESSKEDVLTAARDLCGEERLSTKDKNRFLAHLLLDAQDNSIDVSRDDIVTHIEDSGLDTDYVSIETDTVKEEWEARRSDSGEEEQGNDDQRSLKWDVSSEASSTDRRVKELDKTGSTGNSTGGDSKETSQAISGENNDDLWDTDSSEEESKSDVTSELDNSLTSSDSGESTGEKTEAVDSTDEEDKESIPELDEDEIDEDHTEVRISPESYDLGDSALAMPNYTQDLMGFEYIMGEDDSLVPEGVNGAGIIACQGDRYVGIMSVEGRDWSIHTSDKQRDIVKSYESKFLSGLDSPIEIVSIPTRFDLRDHINRVNEVLDENKDDEDELLMNIGRSMYPNWLESFMSQNDMKERSFYIVVSLSAEQLHQFKSGSGNITEELAGMPVIGGFFSRFVDDTPEDITKYQVLRELNTRMNRIKSNLRRLDVHTQRIDDRDEAMSVLYQYFHNSEPEQEVFPTGQFTTHEKGDAKVGGVSIGDLLEETEPAHDGVEEKMGEQ